MAASHQLGFNKGCTVGVCGEGCQHGQYSFHIELSPNKNVKIATNHTSCLGIYDLECGLTPVPDNVFKNLTIEMLHWLYPNFLHILCDVVFDLVSCNSILPHAPREPSCELIQVLVGFWREWLQNPPNTHVTNMKTTDEVWPSSGTWFWTYPVLLPRTPLSISHTPTHLDLCV